jgi:predicted nucleic acid-binding protein
MATTRCWIASLDGAVLMSVVTRVELGGGVYRESTAAGIRRARLNVILGAIPTLAFDTAAADAYGTIVVGAGYSRRELLDRMMAAQALVHRATLVTLNAEDFQDVPGLAVRAW